MRTHPKIAAALKRSVDPQYRKALERADAAHKLSRAYQGSGSQYRPTENDVLAHMHAQLVIAGVNEISGMDPDVWLMRGLRDLDNARKKIS